MSIIFKTNVNVSEIFGKYLTPSLSKLFTVEPKSTFFEVTAATVMLENRMTVFLRRIKIENGLRELDCIMPELTSKVLKYLKSCKEFCFPKAWNN